MFLITSSWADALHPPFGASASLEHIQTRIAGGQRPSQQGMIMACRRGDATIGSTCKGKPLSLPWEKVQSGAPFQTLK